MDDSDTTLEEQLDPDPRAGRSPSRTRSRHLARKSLISPATSWGPEQRAARNAFHIRHSSSGSTAQSCVEKCRSVLRRKKASACSSWDVQCEAIESVGRNQVSCKNLVTDFIWRRASYSLTQPLKLFCSVHITRLNNRQACPFCGLFCGHGVFLMCNSEGEKDVHHLFHAHCFRQHGGRRCPHCWSTQQPSHIYVSLQNHDAMRIHGQHDGSFYLPNGKCLPARKLPPSLTAQDLEQLLSLVTFQHLRYLQPHSLLTATRSGDRVQLLQLLYLGYSPHKRFHQAQGGTALHVACSLGNLWSAYILLLFGANLDSADGMDNTPLMLASHQGHDQLVHYLLSEGAEPWLGQKDGLNCLHLAARNGHLPCVSAILSGHSLSSGLNRQDTNGWTALMWACMNKHMPIIRYLLIQKADVTIQDDQGNSALHLVALVGRFQIAELLLDAGCAPNATNVDGDTPLHIAVRLQHYDLVCGLLARAVRRDIKNKRGQLPVDCMVSCGSMSKMLHAMLTDSPSWQIVCSDISRGKEKNRIECVTYLEEDQEPQGFVYVTQNCQTKLIPVNYSINKLQSCDCFDHCAGLDSCSHSDKPRWYDQHGRLSQHFNFNDPPNNIVECNSLCPCNVDTCLNRVLQRGPDVRLQLFRTEEMGWGVRTLEFIRKGSLVAEYVGEIISDAEAQKRDDTYLFDIDDEGSKRVYCIDANRFGGVSRFINHSCNPNLMSVKVYTEHQDARFPQIALFAKRDILPGQDLGFDYGERFWVVKCRQYSCHCRSAECRYSRDKIGNFLLNYYLRQGEPLPDDLYDLLEGHGAMASVTSSR